MGVGEVCFTDKKKTILIEFPSINRKIVYKASSQDSKTKWVNWLKEAIADIDAQPSVSSSLALAYACLTDP